jgi:hypothetical protein
MCELTFPFIKVLTRSLMATVLSRQQLNRRWSTLNTNSAPGHLPESEEDSWLDQVLQFLVDTHSPGMMGALSFDVTQSRYSVWSALVVRSGFHGFCRT